MIVTVFRSRLMPGLRDDYVKLVDRMIELAANHAGLYLAQGLFRRRRRARDHRRIRDRRRPSAPGACTRNTATRSARRAKFITPPTACRFARLSASRNSTATRGRGGRMSTPNRSDSGQNRRPCRPLDPHRQSRHEITRRRLIRPEPREAAMEKFTTLEGVAAPLKMINVDTDMVIPKQYLKTIKRTGLGQGPVLRDALQGRRQREPGLRAQQAGLSQGQDPGRRRQFRLRLVAASTRPGR